MRTGLEQIIEGCILAEDIKGKSKEPLMRKETVMDEEMLGVLRAFLVKEVDVQPYLTNGDAFQPGYRISSEVNESVPTDFFAAFRKSTELFRRNFHAWQSGVAIDIPKVREIVLPLADLFKDEPKEILKIPVYYSGEEYIVQHCLAVSIMSYYMAKELNFPSGEMNQIALAGVLSDCGMSKIQSSVLLKKLALTDREFAEIKQHSISSYKMIKDIATIKEGVKVGVLQHHERMDGSGYPLGVKGDQLHPYGKIVALADTFMAMICPRPYREGLSPFKVFEEIKHDSFGKFDLTAVNVLSKLLVRILHGSRVRISNGEIGEVIFTDSQKPVRPIVSLESGEMIQLERRMDLYIVETL
ncbi:HD-GYP domain-containing protein [Bacillus sp. FJAT-42376]|uniref:HD-GYP domain-containing protein n=1 Tax=Bacillus sp. FJAT-42376 TaxID=2014076 RepID=UPI000F502F9A|nr:HD-GYP domain-containing protein [Bacillus sp. FJAT-42376]AZB41147.1 HD-GYP domain-containing protein [Bacillus sp. FJAT-42376]